MKPAETIQKLLLSTPSHFTAEYEGSDFILTHAWPGYASSNPLARFRGSPLARQFLVLTFRTESLKKSPGVVVPNYEPTGDFVAAMMAVLFGKRFDTHGALEMTGAFPRCEADYCAD